MKTWLRDDGVWVSEKPDNYVVGGDIMDNPVLYTDSVVLVNTRKQTGRILNGANLIDHFYSYRDRGILKDEIYPFNIFAGFVKKGYITTTEPDEFGMFKYFKNNDDRI